MVGWMTLCSILINGAAAGLLCYELQRHKDKYPVWKDGKPPKGLLV